jgi:hypothetical protein
MCANDQAFIDAFSARFDNHENEIDGLLPDGAELRGNKRDKLVIEYDIDVDEYDDFFEAYVAGLQAAYRELIAENAELVSKLEELFLDSLSEVYDFEPAI